jgi:hypothetical protein
VAAMLDRALRRASRVAEEPLLTAHDRHGIGKMDPCRLCVSPSPR